MSKLPEDSPLIRGEPVRPIKVIVPVRKKPQLKGKRNIFVGQDDWQVFKAKAAKAGISVSEMVRRLVYRYKPDKNKARSKSTD